ncbi:MAG: PEP-CTERM sorting domain-containing protein [Aquincola tertiaricarbonis]|uniref:PEP-CTERM sorting domain-containing protein n=1 Tax=Aquincola tertiaricarbonis TaxID=391953 RepID=UPI000614A67E|nr:PEP-CTERM sorting domain-containing protein [Aquincola tertiaricarbonis]
MARTSLLPLTAACALACALAVPAAQAAVAGGTGPDFEGGFENIAYGLAGNVFQLTPRLFINGLGSPGGPASVTTLNSALDYAVSVAGAGSGLMTVDYRITNSSATDSFSQLRFMVFANPDGEQLNFLDRVTETWGAAVAGDPVRREVHAATADPFDNILGRFAVNANLTDAAPDAACLAPAGCDAVMGLQWNAPTLGPNESLLVRLALSDDGRSVSGRSLSFAGVGAAGTTLTVSGFSQVTAVPEPSTWAMALAGLAVVARLAGRRARRLPA